MAGGRYTVEQLEHLRESPLVKKPDALPSIEQWMDVPNDHNNNNNNNNNNNGNNNNAGNTANRRARANLREGDAAATGEHRADRPLLGAMGQFGRRASTQHGDEPVIGGPPKLNFASATRTKPGQPKEATGITSTDGEHIGDRFPRNDRWRDGDRTRDKEFTNGRRARREEGEGWQNVKGRKSLGQEDFDRGFGRNGDRDRKDVDTENGDALSRRRGDRWGRRDDTAKESEGGKFGTTGQGGWRDRNREREKERDWTRGGGKAEEDPEWMDAPAPKKETKAHTQEDFQRWKEQMKAKDAPVEEKDEPKTEPGFFELPPTASTQQPLKSVATPSALEPHLGSMFGNWSTKAAESGASEPASVKAKPDKKSRFMNMFAKPEEPTAATLPPAPAPVSPAPAATDRNADQEGFQRILQMLGGTNIGSAPAPQPSAPTPPTNGIRQGGGISLDFHQSPPPPEMQERRPPPQQMPSRSSLETQALLENILAPRPSGLENRPSQQSRFNSMSPDNALFEQFGLPRPESNRPADEHPYQQPPSRNNNPQDPNLAALLNSRSQVNRDKGSSAERDFLLNLMQQPRATPPQLGHQNLPRQPMENQNLPFYDQPRQQPGQPKGRGGPPPGFMNERMDPRMDAMYVENELMRQEQERRNQVRELQQQEATRHKNRGMPMGFPENERDVMAGLQRRNTASEIPRQLTNMGIPSQHVPDLPYMSGRQPGMPPTPQEGPNVRPPPGFNGPMRQPPGLGGPGPQHQMGPGPSFSAGNTPMGAPPGFNPANNLRGGIFPGAPGLGGPGNGMQGPPQGYFPPPQGYGPPMGLRGEDPRMMFEQQQFGGPGPRQQQQGRPPNMY